MFKQCRCAVGVIIVLASVAGPVWSATLADELIVKKEQPVSGKVQGQLAEAIQMLQSAQQTSSAKAINSLQRVASVGNRQTRAEAWLWLGRAYRDGLAGTGKDAGMAFDFFEKAAGREGLNVEAQYELGRAYLNGEGTDRNLIAAYMWTELSLHTSSKMSSSAEAQKARLVKMLNDAQLEKARELVNQLETLYLK